MSSTLGQFSHIIAGSTEAAYAVMTGAANVSNYVVRFFLPTICGNMCGGAALAALLNHAVARDFTAKASGGANWPASLGDKLDDERLSPAVSRLAPIL